MMTVQQAFDLALQHHQAGRLADAEALYRQILAVQPNHPDALHLLGVAAHQHGQYDMAAELIRNSIGIKPDNPATYSNLGEVYRSLGRIEDAISAYRRAIELAPSYAQAHYNLGNALKDVGHLDGAIDEYARAIQCKADYVGAYINFGNALKARGRLKESVDAYRSALGIEPANPMVHYNLGIVLKEMGQLDEAVTAFQSAIHLRPDFSEATTHLGNALKDQGQIERAIAVYQHTIQLQPNNAAMHSNLIHALEYLPDTDDNRIKDEQQRWNLRFASPIASDTEPRASVRKPDQRLRIGYVSPDFRRHVVGSNLLPLFRCHQHEDFEIICYSGATTADEMTEKFRHLADQWRSTVDVCDDALADMIRHDGIDILVDLSQHTGGNRLPVFARRPAPVQVSFAGYPGSTGLEAITYRISDRWLEPDTEGGSWKTGGAGQLRTANSDLRSAEQIVLIDSFWCYDSGGIATEIGELPASRAERITFGSLNNFCKVNEPLLKLWARVLGAVKDSGLVFLSHRGSHCQRTLEFLEQHGVARQRIEFVEPRPREEYLELYQRLDIVLDPFPYNGHTTSLDALWMGVPVVSLAGERAVSRAGLSQLTNLGLPELVAHSENEYVEIAVKLAGDLPRLAELRATLRKRMEASVLMDAPRFARQIEDAYRAMWRQWCAENPAP